MRGGGGGARPPAWGWGGGGGGGTRVGGGTLRCDVTGIPPPPRCDVTGMPCGDSPPPSSHGRTWGNPRGGTLKGQSPP